MFDTIKHSLKEFDYKLNPDQENLLNIFCEWRVSKFEKIENDEEQRKVCEKYLRQSIEPFVKDLLFSNGP